MNHPFTVYKASAGSGKTFTLAVEYIALLVQQKSSDEFLHILAVTFTNLATSEMKGRILQYLYAIANNTPGSEDFMQKLMEHVQGSGLSEQEVRQRAGNSLKAILHDYTHFRVETIDTFFQSILRNLAHELKLNANLQVELDNKQLTNRAVDLLIEGLTDSVQDKTKQSIERLVKRNLEEGKSWEVTKLVKNVAACIYKEEFMNRPDVEKQRMHSEAEIENFCRQLYILKENKSGLEVMRKAKEHITQRINSMKLNFNTISNSATFEKFIDNCADLVPKTEIGKIIAKAFDDPSNMVKSAGKGKPKDARMLTEAEQIVEMLKELKALYDREAGVILTATETLKYIHEMRLLGAVEDKAEAIAGEYNQFCLSKTPALLSGLIKENDTPFVYERAGIQFRHVMIDEFQDTSRMQWENFKVLLLNNLAEGGHDLVVGDIKQSIYRWRNGDWKILKDIQSELSYPVHPETLDTNYRSQYNIISFNNDFFPIVAKTLDAIEPERGKPIQEIYADVHQLCGKEKKDGQQGYVRMKLQKTDSKNDPDYRRSVAQDMIDQIRALKSQGVDEREMAILVRINRIGTELIGMFKEMASDIKLVSDEAFVLESSTAVQMIVNALRILANPTHPDRVALRYMCLHYSLDVLHHTDINPDDFCLDAVENILPKAFMSRLRELSGKPLYMLCEELYRILHLDEIAGQDAYVMGFLDEIQNYLRNATADIASILAQWDESISQHSIPSGKVEGIRILTMHKSKGLQFHTVLIPYTDWSTEEDMKEESMWALARTEDGKTDSRFSHLGKMLVGKSNSLLRTFYHQDYEQEHFDSRIDTLNLLYVAFTRAERNLLAWGRAAMDTEKTDISGDLIYNYVAGKKEGLTMSEDGLSLVYELGTPMGGTSKKDEKPDENRMSTDGTRITQHIRTYKPTMTFVQSNDSQRFVTTECAGEDATQTYTDIGKIMHYVLSKITTTDDIDRVLDECDAAGRIENQEMRQQVLASLRRGFQNPLVQGWFSHDVQVINESNIVGQSKFRGQQIIHRPDRVIIKNDEITVIDYKFGKPYSEYADQVHAYMDLIQQMNPDAKVHGYLWYVYSNKTEEVNL